MSLVKILGVFVQNAGVCFTQPGSSVCVPLAVHMIHPPAPTTFCSSIEMTLSV
jgi:hypothetical protein